MKINKNEKADYKKKTQTNNKPKKSNKADTNNSQYYVFIKDRRSRLK